MMELLDPDEQVLVLIPQGEAAEERERVRVGRISERRVVRTLSLAAVQRIDADVPVQHLREHATAVRVHASSA